MKKYIFLLLGVALSFASCKDPNKTPVLTFEKATVGAYPRLVKLITGEYDLMDLSNSALKYQVQFVDESNGSLVSEYVINARYDGSNVSKDMIEYKRIPKSSFTDFDGNKGADVSIPLTDVLNAFGIDVSETAAGDIISFSTTLVMDDGRTFSAGNSSPTVRGNAFQGYFTYTGKLTCPLPDDKFVGTYVLSYADDQNAQAGFTYPFAPGEVSITTISGSSTRRSIGATWLPGVVGAAANISFDVVCDIVVFEQYDSGLGCGGGSIVVGPGAPAPIDISNDNVITINLVDYKNDGGCGVGAINKTMILTKK